jgi:integrase
MDSTTKRLRPRRPYGAAPFADISMEQIDRIIAIANADPCMNFTRDVLLILAHTGIRSGELRTLRVADIDLAHSRMQISRPKTFTNGRCVPLSPEALDAIESLLARHTNFEFLLGDNARNSLMQVACDFRRIASEIHLNRVTLHSLRRSFAARFLASGLSVVSVANLVGNSHPNSTIRYLPGSDKK